MSKRIALPLLMLLLPASATAADSQLAGQFFFSSSVDPGKIRCAKVTSDMAVKLAAPTYRCSKVDVSSGGSATDCSKLAGGAGYLIFPTKAACERERETQAVAE